MLVVGPGLGRDELMQETVARVLEAARKRDMAVVLDADALQLVQDRPHIVRGWTGAVLHRQRGRVRPSAQEAAVRRGRRRGGQRQQRRFQAGSRAGRRDRCGEGAARTAFQTDPRATPQYCSRTSRGGKKRSGGQGDTLTGAIATFLAWRMAYMDRIWDVGDDASLLDPHEMVRLAAFGGSAITRVSSHLRSWEDFSLLS